MKRLKAESGKRKAERRRATTLAEVLVSIMILSIGLISLATLFPISILRSLQATQLTNSAILSTGAETAIGITPELIFNPDGDTPANANGFDHLTEHFQVPNTSNYIVDPLGFSLAALDSTIDEDFFGEEIAAEDRLPRFPGVVRQGTGSLLKLDTKTLAREAVTLPDSWVFQIDGVGDPTTNSTTSFTFDDVTTAELQTVSIFEIDTNGNGILDNSEVDLNGNGTLDIASSRIVLFDVTGKKSQVRTITMISSTTVSWDDPINYPVGIARIETQETRYTWLLTVRQSPSPFGSTRVDVVVLFRRPDPSIAGEKHYVADFRSGVRDATVTFLATDDPVLKKGGYILDAKNAHWYRIQNITSKTATGATLRLDRPALADSNAAMLVEGVIEVFPLEPRHNTPYLDLWEQLN